MFSLSPLLKKLGDLFQRQTGSAILTPEMIFGLVQTNAQSGFAKYLTMGTGKVWATFKACDLVGKVVMDTPFNLYRGTSDAIEVKGLSDILKSANEFETFKEILYKTVFHLKLTGNAYWLKDQANENGDRPKAIYALNPRKMKIVIDPQRGLLGYIYQSDLVQVPFEREEIMHFRNPSADREYYGIGDIEAGIGLFDQFVNRQTWANKFWQNGASPSGLLIGKEITSDTAKWAELKRSFQRDYGGTANSGKMAFLMGEWNYQQVGLSSVEMQDGQQYQQNVKDIFTQHGVPLSVAGIDQAANYATARIDDLRFRRYTVKPQIGLIADTMQSDLVDGFDARAEIRFELAGLTDLDQIVTAYVPLFDRGVLSINELREAMGIEKIEDPLFEQHFISAGLTPLELSGIALDQNATQAAQRAVERQIMRTLDPANG